MTLTNTEAVTDLSILEALDFSIKEPCEWCAVQHLSPEPAAFYLRRPACPCLPTGKVFPACRGWVARHASLDEYRATCCGAVYATTEIIVVGEVR